MKRLALALLGASALYSCGQPAFAGQAPNPANVSAPLTTGHGVVATGAQSLGDSGGAPGTVTSAALSLPAQFSCAGSPITGSGTFSCSWATTPTGSGAVVLAASPTLTTPALGTPSAINLANATNLPPSALPNPSSSSLGGVESAAAVSNEWISSISTSGVPALSQPGFSNLSGAIALSQITASALAATGISAPTAPASTSAFQMQGLAAVVTPATSGETLITVSGTLLDNGGGATTAAGTGVEYEIKYGTGTAPSNGATSTGTTCNQIQIFTLPSAAAATADVAQPFSLTCKANLTAGTAYWIDLSAQAKGTASAMAFSAVEVLAAEIR